MKIFIYSVAILFGQGKSSIDDSIESVLPPLTENQKRALNQFADHKVFAEAWKHASSDLHRRYREIRDKSHHGHIARKHHKKIRKVVYVDDDSPDSYDEVEEVSSYN